MYLHNTALLLLGFQNDYFSEDGVLRSVIASPEAAQSVLNKTVDLATQLRSTSMLIVSIPMLMTEHCYLLGPVARIWEDIYRLNALQAGTPGAAIAQPFAQFGHRLTQLTAQQGLDGFAFTGLDSLLQLNQIEHVVVAGAIASMAVAVTARTAYELGYEVTVLEDCLLSLTHSGLDFFNQYVFPRYSQVTTCDALLSKLDLPKPAEQLYYMSA